MAIISSGLKKEEGEEVFRRERGRMRLYFIRRLAHGLPLMPSEDELNKLQKK